MLELIPRKHRTLIFTILGVVLVLLMLYVFDRYRLDEWSVGIQPAEGPPASIAH